MENITQEKFDEIARIALETLGQKSNPDANDAETDRMTHMVVKCQELNRSIATGLLLLAATGVNTRSLTIFLLAMFQGGLETGRAIAEYQQLERLNQP